MYLLTVCPGSLSVCARARIYLMNNGTEHRKHGETRARAPCINALTHNYTRALCACHRDDTRTEWNGNDEVKNVPANQLNDGTNVRVCIRANANHIKCYFLYDEKQPATRMEEKKTRCVFSLFSLFFCKNSRCSRHSFCIARGVLCTGRNKHAKLI